MGMTLVEVLIAAGLAGVVGATILVTSLHLAKGTQALTNYSVLHSQSREALDNMSRRIRTAQAVSAYATNAMSFRTQNGTTLTYAWNPANGRLVEMEEGRTRVLLEQCDEFLFQVYQRSPMSNQFALFDTTTALGEAKLVQVSWRCARSAGPSPEQTEDKVSAKIMMRLP